jgi:hypothetical protein
LFFAICSTERGLYVMTNLRSLSDLFRAAMKLVAACAFATAIAGGVSAQTNTFPENGNAGIGTTSPSYPLTVNQTGNSVNTILGLANDSAGSSAQTAVGFFEGATQKFKFGMNSSTAAGYVGGANAFQLWHFLNAPIVFGTNSVERMRITGTGNVGIGTTGPTYRLHVFGNAGTAGTNLLITDSNTTTTAFDLENTSSGAKRWRLQSVGSAVAGRIGNFEFVETASDLKALVIQPGGNVGIGTTSPAQKLHVNGSTRFSNASSGFVFDFVPEPSTNDRILQFENASSLPGGGWAFRATDGIFNAVRLKINNDGKVGIGTTTPAYKLDVAGEIRSSSGGFRFPDGSVQTTAASGGGVTSVFGRTGAVVAATNDYTWAQINKTAANAGDLAAGTLLAARMPALTGDVTTSVGTVATTLSSTGVSAGSYTNANITVDAKGRITAASNGSGGPTAFSDITAGTNTVALVVGNGGSFGVSGTGTINATSLTNAANITSGTVPTARLASGTANNTTFLRGDNTWAAVTSSQWTTGTGNISYTAGNVGIGVTPNSSYKLDVAGNINSSGTITGNIINAKYQDLAEWVPSSEQLSSGTVVVLDTTKSNQVVSSGIAYDTRVAGVISAQPGITLGESGEGKVLVATTGRVRVKVDASRGPIQIGDLLVTSDVSGVAMKSEAVEFAGRKMHMPGTIIGKALEPLAKGSGEILVLLSLQ